MSERIKSLPKYSPFSLAGLAFFRGSLFVGSNIGLIEVRDEAVARILRFHTSSSVVSEPILDSKDKALWVDDDGEGDFLRFDGTQWIHVPWPKSPNGFYTQADVGAGPKLSSSNESLLLAVGGDAWLWNSAAMRWVELNTGTVRNVYGRSSIAGVLPMDGSSLFIVRQGNREESEFNQRFGRPILWDQVVDFSHNSKPLTQSGPPYLAESWTVVGDTGYICSKAHALLQVNGDTVSTLNAPGDCEAVANEGEGNLLVSIRTKGVYRYFARGGWSLVAPHPYPSGEGDYRTYLAAESGQIALAVSGKPVIDQEASRKQKNGHLTFTRNAPAALWVLKNGTFISVPFQ